MQPSTRAGKEPPSFFTELKGVLQRVFTPSKALHRQIASIETYTTGYIGLDKAYEFSKHLSTIKGAPIVPDAHDCYVSVLVTDKPPKSSYKFLQKVEAALGCIFAFIPKPSMPGKVTLPSSLFQNAVEGNKVLYRQDNVPIELTLKQKNDPQSFAETFQEALSTVLEEAHKQNRYLYIVDIPPHERTLMGIPIAKDASLFDASGKALPLEQSTLDDLSKKFRAATITHITWYGFHDGQQQLLMDLPGVPLENIRYILDGTRLLLLAQRSDPERGDFCREQKFDKKIDPQSIQMKIENGILKFEFRFEK